MSDVEANSGVRYDERNNGLDHIAFNVADRADYIQLALFHMAG